ncbi:MAG: hypothetical protein JJU34_13705 [Lunatimonas sp.]|uniref:hypothetical protein n=1 Tax=Lunatimonas sp. TaxID=2060141 RepID=UPI00263A8E9E|nr:hypothetical protein [Lunatimonas sp.]MCC5938328.1 hypothetical protein [Lunatimonas sp.]
MKNANTFLPVLTLLCFLACGEKQEPDIGITGKWRLMKAEAMSTTDYSNDRIVYEFRPNGTLSIETRSGTPPWRFDPGNHTYEFYNQDTTNWEGYSLFGNLQINDRAFGCYLSTDKMVIVDNPALDGPLVYFERHR